MQGRKKGSCRSSVTLLEKHSVGFASEASGGADGEDEQAWGS